MKSFGLLTSLSSQAMQCMQFTFSCQLCNPEILGAERIASSATGGMVGDCMIDCFLIGVPVFACLFAQSLTYSVTRYVRPTRRLQQAPKTHSGKPKPILAKMLGMLVGLASTKQIANLTYEAI